MSARCRRWQALEARETSGRDSRLFQRACATSILGWPTEANRLKRSGRAANDLLVSAPRKVLVLINNNDPAAPGFADPLSFEIGPTLPPIEYMVAGDVDGDGDVDVAYTDRQSFVTVRRNNGDGTFGAEDTYDLENHALPRTGPLVMEDIDSDGHTDIVTVNLSGNNITILLNNGDGTFRVERFYAAGAAPKGLAVADLDGDGALDVAVINQLLDPLRRSDPRSTVSILLNRRVP